MTKMGVYMRIIIGHNNCEMECPATLEYARQITEADALQSLIRIMLVRRVKGLQSGGVVKILPDWSMVIYPPYQGLSNPLLEAIQNLFTLRPIDPFVVFGLKKLISCYLYAKNKFFV